MAISKTDYILRSLQKVSKKKWELFIVSRIIHCLNDDDIEFVTQQLVHRPDGARALTDIFFPQFSVHLEIDEPFHTKTVSKDDKRSQDIVEVTGHDIRRIAIADKIGNLRPLSQIIDDTDNFVEFLKAKKRNGLIDGTFVPWNFESRYSAAPVIAKGYLSVEDNVVFKTQVEALRCFGFTGSGYQRGAWRIPDGSTDVVWFPRLYEHGMWHNELAENGLVIKEEAINAEGRASIAKQLENERRWPGRKHIVFAKAKDVLGFNLLRFVGTFKVNVDLSTENLIWFDRCSSKESIRKIR
jgi:hypothetical protein